MKYMNILIRQFVVNFKRLQSVGSKKIKENIFKEEDGIWALSCSLTPFSSFKMCNLQKTKRNNARLVNFADSSLWPDLSKFHHVGVFNSVALTFGETKR